jgi:hypothetical protein
MLFQALFLLLLKRMKPKLRQKENKRLLEGKCEINIKNIN